MIKYSYNQNREGLVFAGAKDINASFKDLCNVCDSIRYKSVPFALNLLEEVQSGNRAIEFKRHNRYMGDRHELGGKKGRWPKKCAALVRKVVVNASANAKNKGDDPESMYIVHASANKTVVVPRRPPKGLRTVRTGGYGYPPTRRSDIELAKIEVAIGYKEGKSKPAEAKQKPAQKLPATKPAKQAQAAKPAQEQKKEKPAVQAQAKQEAKNGV